MNNKGQHGFYLLLVIGSLVLVVMGVLVAFQEKSGGYLLGEGLRVLLPGYLTFSAGENYLDYTFRFSTFRALEKLGEQNDIITEDDMTKEKLIMLIEEEFSKEIKKLADNGIVTQKKTYEVYELSYPASYNVKIEETENGFKSVLETNDELQLKNTENKLGRNTPKVVLHKKLNFEHSIDFDLNIYQELYEKYGDLTGCPSGNELFDEKNVKCSDDSGYLHFEVETKDLGLIKPMIKFRVLKPGKLDFS